MSDIKKAIELLRRASSGNSAELAEILGAKRTVALYHALREPTVMDLAPALCAAGWVMDEVEFLAREVRPDEAIKSWDVWSVTTSERVTDRGELRSKNRPGSWTRVDTWEASFPRIPDRGKINTEKSDVVD
jgi:hypothetical protein